MNTGKQEDLKAAYRSAPPTPTNLPITNVLVSPPHIMKPSRSGATARAEVGHPSLSRPPIPAADRGSVLAFRLVGARPVLARYAE